MGWAQSTASVLLFMIITGTVSSNVAAAQTLPPLTVASVSAAATVDRAADSGGRDQPGDGYLLGRGDCPDRATVADLHRATRGVDLVHCREDVGLG